MPFCITKWGIQQQRTLWYSKLCIITCPIPSYTVISLTFTLPSHYSLQAILCSLMQGRLVMSMFPFLKCLGQCLTVVAPMQIRPHIWQGSLTMSAAELFYFIWNYTIAYKRNKYSLACVPMFQFIVFWIPDYGRPDQTMYHLLSTLLKNMLCLTAHSCVSQFVTAQWDEYQ